MKKLVSVGLIAVSLFFLGGCSPKEAITSDKQEYIVASLGFDNEMGKISMLIEAIVVNTDDLKEDKENFLISGSGSTVDEAFSQILSQITQPLSLGHNAVTVIGSKITEYQLEEIFEFCKNTPELNIATMLVSAKGAKEALSCETVSSVAVGYDIMSMLKVSEEEKGIVFKNRLYEVWSLAEKPLKTFAIPYIGVNEDKAVFKGLSVFKEGKALKTLDTEEVPIFCVITDSLTSGETVIDGERIRIKYSKTTYGFEFNEVLEITLNARIKAEGDTEPLKQQTELLLSGNDIFGLGNIISQKEPEIWDKIKSDYEKHYRNAKIRVRVYE